MRRTGLRICQTIPDPLYWLAGLAANLPAKTRNLVLSAAGLCFLLCDSEDPQADFQVGQLMQQSWLELTARNYAVQPLMSLPALDNLRTHDLDGAGRGIGLKAGELTSVLQKTVEMSSHERVAVVLRFGRASPPSGRTGRRGAATVTTLSGGLERNL